MITRLLVYSKSVRSRFIYEAMAIASLVLMVSSPLLAQSQPINNNCIERINDLYEFNQRNLIQVANAAHVTESDIVLKLFIPIAVGLHGAVEGLFDKMGREEPAANDLDSDASKVFNGLNVHANFDEIKSELMMQIHRWIISGKDFIKNSDISEAAILSQLAGIKTNTVAKVKLNRDLDHTRKNRWTFLHLLADLQYDYDRLNKTDSGEFLPTSGHIESYQRTIHSDGTPVAQRVHPSQLH